MDKGRGAPGPMSRMLPAPGWDGCPAPTTRIVKFSGSSRYFHGYILPWMYTTILPRLDASTAVCFHPALYTSTEKMKNLSVHKPVHCTDNLAYFREKFSSCC